MRLKKINCLKGEITIPGDKSISHRAIMLGSLAKGNTIVSNFLQGADCLSTISCFRQMGIEIEQKGTFVSIKGNGLYGLKQPSTTLDVGNSGTTIRLLSGILCAQKFPVTITGDDSIQKRPMGRIILPLSDMGAHIASVLNNDCVPLQMNPSVIKGIHYQSPIASAQVKSAILLAGLYAKEPTSVTEPYVSRNHTEIMLDLFGASVSIEGTTVTATPGKEIIAKEIEIPGDISSAAYFIAAALIVPNSEVVIKQVGINPTRNGILRVCEKMGATISIQPIQDKNGEPTADLVVRSSSLKGITISGSIIPTLIDELPIIAILAAYADGETIIKDAAELKVKESNRIDTIVHNLSLMGADITATEDGMIIHGGKPLHGAVIDSKMDHRIAMSFAIASLIAHGGTEILNDQCVDISYPSFYKDLKTLIQ